MRNVSLLFLVFILTACVPAQAPSPTPIVSVTNTATSNPTVAPSPTIMPSPTPAPHGPCDNPLVPLAIGNQWTYQVTSEDRESQYTLKSLERADGRNIVTIVELTAHNNGNSVREPVVCMDAAIEDFPLFMMDMLFANYLNDFFNTYHERGIYAPAHEVFVENGWTMNWDAEYLTEDTAYIKNPLGASDLVILESSPMDLYFEMDGTREAVTVPAGEFLQTLKVKHVFNLTVTLTLPTGGTGGLLTIYTTQWYEPYVGLVRAQLDSASLRMGMQEFSVPMESTLELVEFKAGD